MTAMAQITTALGEVRPLLLKLARQQLRSNAVAEDVVSETIIAAIEQSHRFEERSRPHSWVIGILKHKIVDQLRRQKREVSIEGQIESGEIESVEDLYTEDGVPRHLPLDWGDPEARLNDKEFLAVMEGCVSALPTRLAKAFLMREWLEFETPDICAQLKISQANCNVMLFRARMRLRECIEARWLGTRTPDCCG